MKWETYFKNFPENWDMIYFGGNHNIHIGVRPPTRINENVVKLHHTYSAHFIGIKNTVFDLIEENIKKCGEPLDVSYSRIQKSFNCYSTSKPIAKQKSGYSDIQNTYLDYGWLIN